MKSGRAGQLTPGGSSALVRSVCVCLMMALLGVALAGAQQYGLRDLQGKVIGPNDKPLNGAIVYLQSSRNNDVKTFISTDSGEYRFAALSADTDYTVWAAYKGKKSATKTVSSFDSRKLVTIDLHIK